MIVELDRLWLFNDVCSNRDFREISLPFRFCSGLDKPREGTNGAMIKTERKYVTMNQASSHKEMWWQNECVAATTDFYHSIYPLCALYGYG